MDLPMPEWFTIEEVAKRWKVHSDKIYRYAETGQLKQVFRDTDRYGNQFWTEKKPGGLGNYPAYILREEVERWEKEYEGVAKNKPEYLDLNHSCYAEELADAVKAWEYAVKKGASPKTFKEIAKQWLEERGYKGTALDRLSIVVNPDDGKKGGAPKREP